MPLIASLQLGTVLIIVVLVALPVGALVFAMGAGSALQRIGKGQFALEQDFPQSSGGPVHAVSAEVREEEIRQMVQARSDRGVAKGRGSSRVAHAMGSAAQAQAAGSAASSPAGSAASSPVGA